MSLTTVCKEILQMKVCICIKCKGFLILKFYVKHIILDLNHVNRLQPVSDSTEQNIKTLAG